MPRWALPPNTLLIVDHLKQPPWEATFRRWHTFVGFGNANMYVDRADSFHTGKKVVPAMYKQVRSAAFPCRHPVTALLTPPPTISLLCSSPMAVTSL